MKLIVSEQQYKKLTENNHKPRLLPLSIDFSVIVNKYFVPMWHGTSEKNANMINKVGYYKNSTWFSDDRETSLKYAQQAISPKMVPVVMYAMVFKDDLYKSSENYYVSRDVLYNYNGVWASPKAIEYINGKYGLKKKVNLQENQTTIVKDLVDFLNAHFKQGIENSITDDGKFVDKKVIGVIQGNEIVKNITPSELFYRLEDEVKDKLVKSPERSAFIKQVIIDWFNETVTPEGVLSKNLLIKNQ